MIKGSFKYDSKSVLIFRKPFRKAPSWNSPTHRQHAEGGSEVWVDKACLLSCFFPMVFISWFGFYLLRSKDALDPFHFSYLSLAHFFCFSRPLNNMENKLFGTFIMNKFIQPVAASLSGSATRSDKELEHSTLLSSVYRLNYSMCHFMAHPGSGSCSFR